jgi:hypothetical protein
VRLVGGNLNVIEIRFLSTVFEPSTPFSSGVDGFHPRPDEGQIAGFSADEEAKKSIMFKLRTILLLSAAVQSLGIDIHLRGSEEPLLAGAELRVSGDGIDHVAQGFNAAKLILSTSTEARTIASTTCGVEATATEKWISGGLGEDKDAAAARAASKAAMHGALGNRLAGLLKFLKRLKKIRARLYDHIVRVNDVSSTHPPTRRRGRCRARLRRCTMPMGRVVLSCCGGVFFLFGIGFLLFNRQLTIHTLDPPLLTKYLFFVFFYPRSTGQNSKRT